jgi:hypothetical protein
MVSWVGASLMLLTGEVGKEWTRSSHREDLLVLDIEY